MKLLNIKLIFNITYFKNQFPQQPRSKHTNRKKEKQQLKYKPYGITNFKTLDNLTKFFPVEAELPYFKKI